MTPVSRTARLRRVAVLTVLGLAVAAALLGGCIWLHDLAQSTRASEVAVYRLAADVNRKQSLPRAARTQASLTAALDEIKMLAAQNHRLFQELSSKGESDELLPASRLASSLTRSLLLQATLLAHGRPAAADAVAARMEPRIETESKLLEKAESDFDARADRAELISNSAAAGSLLLAALICASLFARLLRSNRAAESARTFREALIESSPDGVFAFDRDRRYIAWNRRMAELTGISAGAAVGHTPQETALGLGPEAFEAGAAALAGQTFELAGERLSLPGLGERIFDVLYAPLDDGEGNVVGALAHLRDVTARTAMEEQLRQSHKLEAIGQLAGGIAHDFNNLLMGIGGHASVALSRAPESLKRELEEIRRAVTRGATLTEELLFFARRRERPFERVDLNATALEAVEDLQRSFDSSISVELDFHQPAWVSGDGAQLVQVVRNLVSNAHDAMPRGGKLRVRTLQAGVDHIQLVVEDTGVGIPDDLKAHVFEPFFTTKDPGHGAGLGLASAYGIVTQCGGSIEIDSAVGRGTRVTVTLSQPRRDELAVKVSSGSPTSATILFVDDDAVVRSVISDGLEQQGHAVVTAASPAEALAYARSGGSFDVLVTDILMPELNGGELSDRLRELRPGFSTIFISGFPATGLTLDERSAFLQKPFQLDELYEIIARHIDAFGEETALRLD